MLCEMGFMTNKQLTQILVLMVEIAITAWVVQYTWNKILVPKTSDKTDEITYWEAVWITVAVKLLLVGVGGFVKDIGLYQLEFYR